MDIFLFQTIGSSPQRAALSYAELKSGAGRFALLCNGKDFCISASTYDLPGHSLANCPLETEECLNHIWLPLNKRLRSRSSTVIMNWKLCGRCSPLNLHMDKFLVQNDKSPNARLSVKSLRLANERHSIGSPGDIRGERVSYVWGESGNREPATKIENIQGRRKSGGLASVMKTLPTALRQSIRLVQELGIRYIWIDAICIV